MMTKKGARKDSLSHAVFSWRAPSFFYFRGSVENTKILIMVLVNVANLPTFLHARTTECTLKE